MIDYVSQYWWRLTLIVHRGSILWPKYFSLHGPFDQKLQTITQQQSSLCTDDRELLERIDPDRYDSTSSWTISDAFRGFASFHHASRALTWSISWYLDRCDRLRREWCGCALMMMSRRPSSVKYSPLRFCMTRSWSVGIRSRGDKDEDWWSSVITPQSWSRGSVSRS